MPVCFHCYYSIYVSEPWDLTPPRLMGGNPCEKLGGSPKNATESKSGERSLSTKNRKGTPPHTKQQTGERPHAMFLDKRQLITAQRGLPETHRRPKVTPSRARDAFQWRGNALLRDIIGTQTGICSLLKSPFRVSSFFLRSYPVGTLDVVFSSVPNL